MNPQQKARLDVIRNRYKSVNTTPLSIESTDIKKEGVLATLARLLSKPKESPKPTPSVDTTKKEVTNKEQQLKLIEAKVRRELNQKRREHKKLETIYNQAIEKGIVKEGTIEALELKENIRKDPAMASNVIKTANVVANNKNDNVNQKTKKQNVDKSIEDIHRKQLQRSGVQYVNPQVNNNTL